MRGSKEKSFQELKTKMQDQDRITENMNQPEPLKEERDFLRNPNFPRVKNNEDESLKKWYREEVAREYDIILAEGFHVREVEEVLSTLEGYGLFALALAHNILKKRRGKEARLN